MRLALLCDDPAVAPWLEALTSGSAHEVTLAATVSPRGGELLRSHTGVRLTNQWEELLIARDIDAVLAGGSEPRLLEAVKQLATAGQPILFLPQAAQGSTYLYELNLIRDDNRVTLFPALPHRRDAALVRLRELLHAGAFGRVQLIQLEREIAAPSSTGKLSLAVVDETLLPDLDLLRWLGGDYDQITSLRTGAENDTVLMQTVTLAGRGLAEATWQVQAACGVEVSRLTVHAERGRTVVECDPASRDWVLTEEDGRRVVGNRVAAARELLDDFAAVLSKGRVSGEWSELVKAFESLDATHRSVRRRRTIELHFEPMSERATFKTQMTAMGCGVLIGTLLLLLAYLAIASLVPQAPARGLPPDGWEWARGLLSIARFFVFAPPVVFLALQLLYPLTRPATGRESADGDQDGR